MRTSLFLSVLSLSLAVTGCGGGARSLGDPKAPSGSQQQAATQLGMSVDQSRNAGSDPDNGPALASAVYNIGSLANSQNLKQGLETATKKPKDFTDPTCVTTTGTTTKYNNCKNSGDSATINGEVSVTGDSSMLTVDYNNLTISGFGGSGTTGNLSLDGTVTITPTSINGALTAKLDATVSGTGGAGTTITSKVDYQNVVLSTECGISGGAIRVDYDISVKTVGGLGVGGASNQGGSAQFEWTACGMYTVRNS